MLIVFGKILVEHRKCLLKTKRSYITSKHLFVEIMIQCKIKIHYWNLQRNFQNSEHDQTFDN